jgi:DNA-binding NarL/FixJ family response regulator
VLIVDDDAAFRSLLRQIVEDAGCVVVGEAANGVEGVALAHALDPDVVTMDLDMPLLDGASATADICASLDSVVVIVSGSQSSNLVGNALRAGARWHLAKRDAISQLPAVLKALEHS